MEHMKRLCLYFAFLVMLAGCNVRTEAPVSIIFDTDIGGDIDDVLALQMVLNYVKDGVADLKAVTIVKDSRKSISLVDGICRFNGFDDVPIGFCRNGVDPNEYYYLNPVLGARNSSGGRLVNPQVDTLGVEDGARVMRRVLASANGPTVIVAVGAMTNVANLLTSEPDDISPLCGVDLVREKLSRLVLMGGMYGDDPFPEYNIVADIPSAQTVFEKCPVEIVTGGWEVGNEICYPAASILEDFGNPMDHPVSCAYCNYARMPFDRPTWDLISVYYALEPSQNLFETSPKGHITIDSEGYSRFVEDAAGKHRYILLPDVDKARAEIVRMTIPSER